MQRPPSPDGLPPGVFRTSDVDALASLGVAIPEHLATLYVRTVRDLRRAFISNPPHARPQARASRGASATARGERSFMHESKDNPHQDNWLAHAQYASSRTELPSATERAHCDIGVDIDHAIYFLATHAPEDVVRWREQQKKRLDEAVANLRPLSNFMEAYGGARPRHVTRVAGQIPLVVCALLLDATLSPDTELPRAFKLGFTLEGRVRDSGIFRKIDEPTAVEFDEQTAPLRQGAWVAWDLLEAKVRANASSVDPATRAELCTRTREQTMLRRMSPPMRKSDLCRLLWGTDEPPGDAAGNRVCPLASMRFGLWQNDKLRPIEDWCIFSLLPLPPLPIPHAYGQGPPACHAPAKARHDGPPEASSSPPTLGASSSGPRGPSPPHEGALPSPPANGHDNHKDRYQHTYACSAPYTRPHNTPRFAPTSKLYHRDAGPSLTPLESG